MSSLSVYHVSSPEIPNKVLQKHQRHTACLAEPSISQARTVHVDELRGGSLVGITGRQSRLHRRGGCIRRQD